MESLPAAIDGSGPSAPPVIVVTAFTHDREIQEIKRNPVVVLFLGKPINQKRLLAALHKVLGTAPPRREEAGKRV